MPWFLPSNKLEERRWASAEDVEEQLCSNFWSAYAKATSLPEPVLFMCRTPRYQLTIRMFSAMFDTVIVNAASFRWYLVSGEANSWYSTKICSFPTLACRNLCSGSLTDMKMPFIISAKQSYSFSRFLFEDVCIWTKLFLPLKHFLKTVSFIYHCSLI